MAEQGAFPLLEAVDGEESTGNTFCKPAESSARHEKGVSANTHRYALFYYCEPSGVAFMYSHCMLPDGLAAFNSRSTHF